MPEQYEVRRREQTWNIYAGSSKSFGDKLALDASLAVEHYKTPVWNQWDWYPIVNLNYMPAPGHILSALSEQRQGLSRLLGGAGCRLLHRWRIL